MLMMPVAMMAQWTSSPVVDTTGGPVRGALGSGGVAVFRGIPYGQEPIGELRWRPPLPRKPWTSVLDATADGAGFFHGEAGREMVFYAYPRDASGVPINTPGLDIVLELSGPSGSPFFALTQRAFIHDASLGRYVMKSSAVTSAGEYDVKVTAGGVSVAPPPATTTCLGSLSR